MAERLTICLLGGGGFVGSRLAARLASAGHRLIIPTRNPALRRPLLVLPTVRVVRADIHQPEVLQALLEGCSRAVNLVGILNERGRDGSGFREAHTELVRRIVTACRSRGVAKLVHVSAVGASAESGPSHYLRTKGEAEGIIIGTGGDCAWTILRPSVIFGPGDSFTNRFAALLQRMPGFFPLAMPEARFAPVHVDDVVAALMMAIQERCTSGRIYELCGPEVLSLREIVIRVRDAMGLRRAIWGLPSWLSRLQAAVMDFVPGKPFSTDNYRSLTVDSLCRDNGLEALGIPARAFSAFLRPALRTSLSRSRLDSLRRQAGG